MEGDVPPPSTRPRTLSRGGHPRPSHYPSSSPQSQLEFPRDLQERIAQPLCLCKNASKNWHHHHRWNKHTRTAYSEQRFPRNIRHPEAAKLQTKAPHWRGLGVGGRVEGGESKMRPPTRTRDVKGTGARGRGEEWGRVPVSRRFWVPRRSWGEDRQSRGASPSPAHPRGAMEWASGLGRGQCSEQQQAPVPGPGLPLPGTLTMP